MRCKKVRELSPPVRKITKMTHVNPVCVRFLLHL